MSPLTATDLKQTRATRPASASPSPQHDEPVGSRGRLAGLLPLAGVAAALLIWALSLHHLQPDRLSDLGLVSVLPKGFFIALAILSASFCTALSATRLRTPVVFLHVAALVLMLYATPTIIEEVPRFAVTWRHLGITDYVAVHGSVDPQIDAYFNWPGFFFLSALIEKLGGVHSLIGAVRWAPLFYEALYLGPLLMIVGAFTRDRRLMWMSVWIFYATNWIGQDYFSPQGFALFTLLVVVAILVRWFPGAAARTQIQGGRRAGLMVALIVIFAAVVPSHQLTPFVILAMTAALVIFRRSDARGLPTLMAVLIAAWVTFMTVAYLSGHIGQLTGGVGNVSKSVNENVQGRVKGSTDHLHVVYTRLLLAAAVWGMAGLGFLRRWRAGRRDIAAGLLAIAPFGLLPLQPYGGELLLRIFLYSLPFMAFLAASFLFPRPAPVRGWRLPAFATVISLGLLGLFTVARYGNERMDAFTQRELTAANRMYEVAPLNSVLMAGGPNALWRYVHYTDYRYKVLASEPAWRRTDASHASYAVVGNAVADTLASEAGKQRRAFLLITRRQEAGMDLLGLAPRGALTRTARAVRASPRFRLIYANRDASLYELRPQAKSAKAGA
jgi:hypothetical protein